MAGRPQGSTGTTTGSVGDVVAPARGKAEQAPSGDVGQLYRALVEHAREAVTIVDASGVVVYHNP
jgi:PAS domain-containing protein